MVIGCGPITQPCFFIPAGNSNCVIELLNLLSDTGGEVWRRAADRSRMDRVANTRFREIMKIEHTITDVIKDKQLIFFEHVQNISETRISKQEHEWKPGGRRRRGRPSRSW